MKFHCKNVKILQIHMDIITIIIIIRLGHKSLAMTLRYSHLAPSHKVYAVNILDDTINSKVRSIQKVYNLRSSKEDGASQDIEFLGVDGGT